MMDDGVVNNEEDFQREVERVKKNALPQELIFALITILEALIKHEVKKSTPETILEKTKELKVNSFYPWDKDYFPYLEKKRISSKDYLYVTTLENIKHVYHDLLNESISPEVAFSRSLGFLSLCLVPSLTNYVKDAKAGLRKGGKNSKGTTAKQKEERDKKIFDEIEDWRANGKSLSAAKSKIIHKISSSIKNGKEPGLCIGFKSHEIPTVRRHVDRIYKKQLELDNASVVLKSLLNQ